MDKTMLNEALELARAGFPVFPLHHMLKGGHCSCARGKRTNKDGMPECQSGKHPRIDGWEEKATTDEAAIREWWREWPHANIGIATGREWPHASGHLAVIDIDTGDGKVGQESLEQLIASNDSLPETRLVKTGGGGTHYYFLTRAVVQNDKSKKLGKNIDVRGWHGYVVAPPSNHLLGRYEWRNALPIAAMPEWMEQRLSNVGTMPAFYRPEDSNVDPKVIVDAYQQTTDEQLTEALNAIPADLITGYEPGSSSPGAWWEVGAALFNISNGSKDGFNKWMEFSKRDPKWKDDYSRKLSQWLSDLERQWNNMRPSNYGYGTIFHWAKMNKKYKVPAHIKQAFVEHAKRDAVVANATYREIAGDILERLDKAEPILFRFGNRIARPLETPRRGVRGQNEIHIETMLKAETLQQALNHQLNFITIDDKGNVSPTNLSKQSATYIMECQPQQFPLKPIVGVTRVPVMMMDGSIHNSPGYSEATQLFHYPQLELPDVPERPSKRDISTASELLQEVYCDMPFAHASDRAHALALLIVPVLRSLIDGDVPGHFITKPVQATGATLLANAAILLKTGCDKTYPQNAPSENAEWKKTILADLLMGAEFCFYDDCRSLRSPELATVLTSNGSYKGRKLATNEMLMVPNRAIWMFLGNNPSLSRDLRRRLIDIRVDAQMSDPGQRPEATFKHPGILPWLKDPKVRGSIIAAIFTLARAWIQRGKPKTKSLASFQDWAHVIGGVLEVASIAGFLESPNDRLVDEQEVETNEFIQCLTAHRVKYPPGAGNGSPSFVRLKASQILEMAEHCQLEIAAGLKSANPQERAKEFVNFKLNPLRDRVFLVSELNPASIHCEKWRAASVKLMYFPVNGDAHWKLMFEHNRGEWKEGIPDGFAGLGFPDIFSGPDWSYRKQGQNAPRQEKGWDRRLSE